MTLDRAQVEVNRARYRALSRQLPLMYGLLVINLFGLSASHLRSEAPLVLTVFIPAGMICFMVARTVRYVRSRHQVLSDDDIY